MTKAVWKFALEVKDRQRIALPVGAKALSVAEQRGTLCLWALVDPDERLTEPRAVCIVGTGHEIDEADTANTEFIGSVLMLGGNLVFHVFVAAAERFFVEEKAE